MTRVKVCGLTRREDVLLAADLGADALGFILAPSPRRVDLAALEVLVRDLPPSMLRVGVVADPAPEEREAIRASGLLQVLQFHGRESPGTLGTPGLGVWKALAVRGAEDLDRGGLYEEADLLVLDGGSPGRGGTGVPFDWSLLRDRPLRRPFFLAGGLGPENLAEALERVRPDGVDLNGRVEREPGIKDPARIRRCVAIAREHEARLEPEAEESRRGRSGPAGREIGA